MVSLSGEVSDGQLEAAATQPGTSTGDSETGSSNTEGAALALSWWGGGAALKAEEEAPECELELETEGGLNSELLLESGGTRPDSGPGAKANSQSELQGASGRSRPRAKLRRNRTVFSIKQVSTLERAFRKNPYPTLADTARLAQELRITEAQVKVWFQNRRKKLKRQLQEQTQCFAPTHSNPFWTLSSPDYHPYPLPHGQTLAFPSTCAPAFGHSLYASQDFRSLGLQMPCYHLNFPSGSLG